MVSESILEVMKALKIIGLAVLVIIVAAGIAAGGYFLAVWHTNSTNDATKTAATTAAKTVVADTTLTPAKETPLTTCNSDELTLTTASSNANGAGTLALSLVLTNSGKRTCILGGFPGVSLVNDNGNQIGKPADRATNYTEKTLTLKPGDSSTTTLTYTAEGNYDPGTCTDGATKLRVYPPNDTGYISVAETAITAWCPSFETSPVQ